MSKEPADEHTSSLSQQSSESSDSYIVDDVDCSSSEEYEYANPHDRAMVKAFGSCKYIALVLSWGCAFLVLIWFLEKIWSK